MKIFDFIFVLFLCDYLFYLFKRMVKRMEKKNFELAPKEL
jgi:hypothetical protein